MQSVRSLAVHTRARPHLSPQASHADSPNSSPPLMMRKSVRRASTPHRIHPHPPRSKNQNFRPRHLDPPLSLSPTSLLGVAHPIVDLVLPQNNRGTSFLHFLLLFLPPASTLEHRIIYRHICIPSYIHTMASLSLSFRFPCLSRLWVLRCLVHGKIVQPLVLYLRSRFVLIMPTFFFPRLF